MLILQFRGAQTPTLPGEAWLEDRATNPQQPQAPSSQACTGSSVPLRKLKARTTLCPFPSRGHSHSICHFSGLPKTISRAQLPAQLGRDGALETNLRPEICLPRGSLPDSMQTDTLPTSQQHGPQRTNPPPPHNMHPELLPRQLSPPQQRCTTT